MAEVKRSWERRLGGEPAARTVEFVESLSVDYRLYKYDIAGSIAHAKMLAEQKLISKREYQQIRKGLLEIRKEIEQGRFRFEKRYEDIHMAIEAALVAKVGEVGKKLHTGRSRNDQVATDLRLWMRDEIDLLGDKLTALQRAFVKLAEKYVDDVMAGYTHLQRAQPVSVASYLLSFVEQFDRDFTRLRHCKELADVSPLGSGALAGSTLPLDRRLICKELGFSRISGNSIDAAGDRDFCAEFIFDCALIMVHLSRFAEDWIIFGSNEFGLVQVDDAYCTSSSMMPQKRNLDLMELIRARVGTVYGSLVGMLTVLKGQPSGYNRDLQEDKVHLFSASETVEASLDVAREIVLHSRFDRERLQASLHQGYLEATALAEYLVRKGVPFRAAHGIVGQLVARCERDEIRLAELKLEQLRQVCPVVEADVYEYLDPVGVAWRYVTEGAAGPKQARRQIARWRRELSRR